MNNALLATGWNDVPSSGGGLYGKPPLFQIATEDRGDERCYAQSGAKCHNDIEKRTIADKIIEALVNDSVLKAENQEKAVQVIMKDSRVKDLIEFSRAVHAEMHAILGASRVAGDRGRGAGARVALQGASTRQHRRPLGRQLSRDEERDLR